MIRHNGVLINETKVLLAKSFKSRLFGLLVYKSMPSDTLMYFPYTHSIHTFFMKFPIDVIFVDSKFKVIKVLSNLIPGRIGFSLAIEVRHVLEGPCGWINQKNIKIGDTLYVDL